MTGGFISDGFDNTGFTPIVTVSYTQSSYRSDTYLQQSYLTDILYTPPTPTPEPVPIPGQTKTFDLSYIRSLRAKVIFQNTQGNTLYTYDSFDPDASLISVTMVDVLASADSVGTATMDIDDDMQVLDYPATFGLGNRVIIYGGKFQSTYEVIFRGYVRSVEVIRQDTGLLSYRVTAYGSRIILTERVVNFKRNTSITNSRDLQIFNMVKGLFRDSNILPMGSPTLVDQGNFDIRGISSRVTDKMNAIDNFLTQASSVMDQFVDFVGGVFYIDYRNNNDRVVFDYARNVDSGITLKDQDSFDDLAVNTSYFIGNWSFTDTMTLDQGFANRIYSVLENAPDKSAPASTSGDSTAGSTKLNDRTLAQRIQANASRFADLSLIISKTAGLPSGDHTLFGAIVEDSGVNTPTNIAVATFHLDSSEIPDEAETVFNLHLQFNVENINPLGYYWIILYKIGDQDRTVLWYHNNDTRTLNQYSAEGVIGDKLTPITWQVNINGPTYSYAAFASTTQVQVADDPFSKDRFGLVETVVSLPWIKDAGDMDDALQITLQDSAKPKRVFTINKVTIPDKLFRVGETVKIIDRKTGMNGPDGFIAEIQEVRYVFDSKDYGLGAKTCDIKPTGHLDITGDFVEEQ